MLKVNYAIHYHYHLQSINIHHYRDKVILYMNAAAMLSVAAKMIVTKQRIRKNLSDIEQHNK